MRQAPPLVVHEFLTSSSAADRRRHRRRRSNNNNNNNNNNTTPGGHPRIFKRLHHSSPKPSDIIDSNSPSPWTTHSFAHHILIARVESPPLSPTPAPPRSSPRSFSRHSLFPSSTDSVPRFSMFRLGSRAKSPRRPAASTVTSTPQNIGPYASNTAPPPPSSAGNYAQSVSPTSQVAPWSNTGQGDSMSSTSPRNSSSRRSAAGSAGVGAGGAGASAPHGFAHANNNNTPGVIPRKKSHSPSSSLSNSIITPTSATSPHNVIPEIPSMPLPKSSKSFLGRRLGKSQQQEPEFDPTTFRKHRTRPAGPRGADAVYQEYDDLFRDDDDDDDELETELDESYDNRHMDSGIESNEDLLLHEGHHQRETQQQPARPQYSRSQHSADRLQQGAPPRLFPRSSSLASLNQSSPPREPVRAPTSSPSTTISPFPPAAKTWPHPLPQRAINTTTPPRSTAPSVDESLDHLPPPPSAIGAPPTPPLPSATRQNYLSIDTNTARDDVSGLHQRFPTPPPQGTPPTPPPSSLPPHMRTTDLRTQERIIPESLGVDIPSPTLFLPTSVGERWGDSPGSAEPLYTPLLPTTYDPVATIASALPFGDSSTRVPLRVDTGASPHSAPTSTSGIDTIRDSGEFEPSLSARNSNGSHEDSRERSVEPRPKEAPSTRTRSGTVSSIISVSGGKASTVSTEPETAATVRQDTAHLRAFRDFIKASGDNDAFVSRGPRYEAFQAQRICTHLPGDEGSSRTTTITTSASSTDLAATAKASGASKKRKATPSAFLAQRDPAEEIKTALWALMALRWLNFGKVLLSPAHGMLLAASAKTLTRRATMKHDDRAAKMLAEATSPGSRRGSGTGVPWKLDHDKRRVLDLGGMPVADWGWHCAVDYPRAQVITVTTPLPIPIPDTLGGPRNHHHLTVPTLTSIPFPDNHFDVVSARTLFLQLHTSDFDPCLTECLRILKPGGYLEFTVIDHDIINAGPLASDLAARFAARLREENRDPEPSRLWIKRLDTAGFEDVKRMWSVLPMAATPRVPKTSKSSSSLTSLNRPGSQGTITTSKMTVTGRALDPAQEELRRKMRAWEGLADVDPDIPPESDDDEENNTGSTKDVAGITGLVGGWCWEKWVHSVGLKEEKMVGRVMEEAKGYGSGWRCLMGYARKPMTMTTPGEKTPV